MPHETPQKSVRQIVNMPALETRPVGLSNDDTQKITDRILALWDDGDAWILGHSTDGVLWGRVMGGRMVLSGEANPDFGPILDQAERLINIRIFCPKKELRIWRHRGQLTGCVAEDKPAAEKAWGYDEYQILVSASQINAATAGGVTFSQLRGPSGQTHAIPVDWDGKGQMWRLKVRHYLTSSRVTGMLTITESRLLDVCPKP